MDFNVTEIEIYFSVIFPDNKVPDSECLTVAGKLGLINQTKFSKMDIS